MKIPKYKIKDFLEFHMDDGLSYKGIVLRIEEKNDLFFYDLKCLVDSIPVIIESVEEDRVDRKYIETVLCYIERDNKYLMLLRNKRENDYNEGKWLGIGGHLEYNEEPDDCLVREVMEETGITLLDYTKRAILYFINDDYTELIHLYTSNSFSGFIKPCDEGTLAWIEKDKIFTLPIWEGDKVFLSEMMKDSSYFEMELYYEHNIFKGSKKI